MGLNYAVIGQFRKYGTQRNLPQSIETLTV